MSKIKITTNESDMYDAIIDGVAMFGGIFVGIVTRYATSVIIPANDTVTKRIFRETGSIALSTAAMNITVSAVKELGQYLKPKIVHK